MDLITENKLRNLAGQKKFNLIYLEKDYFLTVLLYLIKDVKEIYFKGGTALNKIVFNHKRLSEDLDFSCTTDTNKIKKEIQKIVNQNPNFFTKTKTDKNMTKFTRIQVYYKSYFNKNEYINIDLNFHAKIHLKPETKKVNHFYKQIPKFTITMLSEKELITEKIRALFQRNQPRDYFDAYHLIKTKNIDLKLLKTKIKDVGIEYNTEKIYKNAKRIYSKWNQEINHLTNKPITYQNAIKTINKKFKKKEKNTTNRI
jgi:predicted nucleotidyltransferase component of viral defense system